MRRSLILLFIFFFGLEINQSVAQLMKHEAAHQTDSVKIKANRFVFYNDSVYYVQNDTVVLIPDTTEFFIRKNPVSKSDAFYDSVKTKMSRHNWSKMAYDMLFTQPDAKKKKVFDEDEKKLRFEPYEGSVINPTKYVHLKIFGTSFSDTSRYKTNKYNHLLNKYHFYTQSFIIRRNTTFRTHHILTAEEMIDSERLLRSREYIKDARIMVNETEREDTVEVHVVTKDVFPYSVAYRPSNGNGALLGFRTVNLFGIGHGLEYNMIKKGGSELFYTVRNIGASFTDVVLNYADYEKKKGVGFLLNKDFLTIDTKYAGGIEVSDYKFLKNEFSFDIEEDVPINYGLKTQDFWVGRSFKTKAKLEKYGFKGGTRFITSTRVDLQDYYDKPYVSADSNYLYHDRKNYLMEIGFSSRVYYQDNYVVNFGRTEDIPTGTTISTTFGIQQREFDLRHYLGARFSRGGYITNFGYLNTLYTAGGFINEGHLEDVIITIGAEYFTSLKRIGRYRFRQFVTSNLSHVFYPSSDYQLSGQKDLGIRGVGGYYLKATSHLSLNSESLFFTPTFVLGFRLAVFGFADVALAKNSLNSDFPSDFYSGLGIGLRFRNDNLAFPTMNLRLGYYPSTPFRANPSFYDFSTSADLNIRDFSFHKPEIVGFR